MQVCLYGIQVKVIGHRVKVKVEGRNKKACSVIRSPLGLSENMTAAVTSSPFHSNRKAAGRRRRQTELVGVDHLWFLACIMC